MMNSVKSRWLSVPLLFLVVNYCLAQAPSGPVTFAFNSTSAAVYDLSSTYTVSQNIIAAGGTLVPLSINGMPLFHYPSGRLAGTGWISVNLGSEPAVAAFFSASGRVSGGGNNPTRVLLSVALHGNDIVGGVQSSYSISVRYDLEVDTETMSLLGTARGHASFGGLSSGNIRSDNLVIPLPPGVDGTWSAQLDVVALSSLAGSGDLVLSNGRILPVRLAGNFSNNTGLSHIHLWGIFDGQHDARPTSLRMNFLTGAVQPSLLSGTILGQRVIQ